MAFKFRVAKLWAGALGKIVRLLGKYVSSRPVVLDPPTYQKPCMSDTFIMVTVADAQL